MQNTYYQKITPLENERENQYNSITKHEDVTKHGNFTKEFASSSGKFEGVL